MRFQSTSTADRFRCARCGHTQSYFPIAEACEGGEPCNRCRAKKREKEKTEIKRQQEK
jgi:hypothetical protein